MKIKEQPDSFYLYSKEQLEKLFTESKDNWYEETGHLSTMKYEHPSYQRIVGLGKQVIPLILLYLYKNNGSWFDALESI